MRMNGIGMRERGTKEREREIAGKTGRLKFVKIYYDRSNSRRLVVDMKIGMC
jgi:hypothetical protein